MQRRIFTTVFLLIFAVLASAASRPPSPDQIFGDLFEDVQRSGVFEDQKTFVDCVPREPAAKILEAYHARRGEPHFDLKAFVAEKFLIPEPHAVAIPPGQNLTEHINTLWGKLRREQDTPVPGSSLLPLPKPYIVPGGRFREIYYWDSYFTMLGLRQSGREDLIASMVGNFAYLQNEYGVIPNGNRTYFLTRSQPPFFSLMLDVLAQQQGDHVYVDYLPTLKAEHAYWSDKSFPTHHVVEFEDGQALSRYYDLRDTPRPEAFAKEEAVAAKSTQPKNVLYRNLRSAAESGWDFSSRWFTDGKTLETIDTINRVPVDLNCLLQHQEATLAKACKLAGDEAGAKHFAELAGKRKAALLAKCWSPENGYFTDYDLKTKRPTSSLTLAGIAPLFFELATDEQAASVAKTIREKFLQNGGVVTSLVNTGQQWDWPNGWAPLQWMTIQGLEHYGYHDLAAEIARRWLKLNRDVYERTGKMMEKYDVVDKNLTAGGGEYPAQDGFGWTNGVYLALWARYSPEAPRAVRMPAEK
ncbi:MAG TPA: alpha,alpha-trehalase TreF [Opitutaceae bacterium]|nr:alpha,alpha-trehalase TreF [Opitutaceae bacterium]